MINPKDIVVSFHHDARLGGTRYSAHLQLASNALVSDFVGDRLRYAEAVHLHETVKQQVQLAITHKLYGYLVKPTRELQAAFHYMAASLPYSTGSSMEQACVHGIPVGQHFETLLAPLKSQR